ncbi:hypothetical protein [Rhodococcus sp. KRD197]|uniref:hypothetical protein n=1 Tax=Rhodococcus sp. KRD197 TaxID=2729731 RepID=UPI0019D1B2F9|nr:hypothetical protein [Rhodococcus sp. KRD197]
MSKSASSHSALNRRIVAVLAIFFVGVAVGAGCDASSSDDARAYADTLVAVVSLGG